jgi:hypothetical protein
MGNQVADVKKNDYSGPNIKELWHLGHVYNANSALETAGRMEGQVADVHEWLFWLTGPRHSNTLGRCTRLIAL